MPNTVLQVSNFEKTETAFLVDRAALLKEELAGKTEELRQINQTLAARGEFKPGSKTGHLIGRHYQAKIQLKENTKWNQELLSDARELMGDEEFFKVFKWNFEPKNAKALAGALEFALYAEFIEAARTVSPGQPSLVFEKMESC